MDDSYDDICFNFHSIRNPQSEISDYLKHWRQALNWIKKVINSAKYSFFWNWKNTIRTSIIKGIVEKLINRTHSKHVIFHRQRAIWQIFHLRNGGKPHNLCDFGYSYNETSYCNRANMDIFKSIWLLASTRSNLHGIIILSVRKRPKQKILLIESNKIYINHSWLLVSFSSDISTSSKLITFIFSISSPVVFAITAKLMFSNPNIWSFVLFSVNIPSTTLSSAIEF